MATATATKARFTGGAFLIQDQPLESVFTCEDFSDEHKQIAQTTEEFARNEIVPLIERIEHKEWQVTRDLLKKASELGLSNVDVPEEYGGSEMDKISSALIADRIAVSGSFSVSWGSHVGIGTLPIVYFGTKEQKKKYLPKLASGEWIGAYALSESTSASDAMNARTKAVLSPDGKNWVLNGQKMWITNGNFADLFIVFAKVDGEKFSAFIVEKTFPGFRVGAEEKKLGIRGSSTAPLYLEDCQVPKENLLGEIGKGHVIAFNTLNIGRYKLGAGVVGGARNSLAHAIAYAKDRKAWGKSITEFGLIREKLANMAIGVYVGECMSYRTIGMIEAALAEIDKNDPAYAEKVRKGIEEFAVECSILKVWGSEMIDRVVDEVVQVYGGYGFVEEYPAERSFRDARVNRIFEGTNEINRLIITGWLMKRAMKGELALMPAIKQLMDEVLAGPAMADPIEGPLAAERQMLINAKKAGLMCAGVATQKYMMKLEEEQEVLAALADMIIEAYAMESAIQRALKIHERSGEKAAALPTAMARAYAQKAMDVIESNARKVLANCAEGDMLRTQMTIVRRLFKYEPADTIALREQVAARVIEAGKYVL